MKYFAAVLVTLLFVGEAQARECFWSDKVQQVHPISNNRIEIRTTFGNYVATGYSCWALDFARRFDFGPYMNFCEGDLLRTEREQCRIDVIQRY